MAEKKENIDVFQVFKTELRANNLRNLYFFYGEETFLLRHYLEQIRKKCVDELTESFNSHRFTQENFTVQEFVDAVEALPMMAERTYVQVDEIDLFRLNESERERLAELFNDMPDYCVVVFTYQTVEWKPDKRNKKFWDLIERKGCVVEFAKQSQRDLVAWITRHFASYGKRIHQNLCVYLIEITDGTMTSLQGEIKKIAAYSGADEICRADIDAVTEPVLDAVVYQMTDLLGNGEYGKALLKLQQLLKMQEEPLGILGAIGRHFRQIGTAKTLIDCGKNADDLMRLTGMKDYPARKAMGAARKFSVSFCKRSAELILETDHSIKTSLDTPERLLELLILNLAQEARNG